MKIETWISPSGRRYLTRDALPRERLTLPMSLSRWKAGGHSAQNCPVYHVIRRFYGLTEAQAIEVGMIIGKQIVILPKIEPTVENGWIRVRYRHACKAVKFYDEHPNAEPSACDIILNGMSKSVTREARRAEQWRYRQRKARRAVKKQPPDRYFPIRDGMLPSLTKTA